MKEGKLEQESKSRKYERIFNQMHILQTDKGNLEEMLQQIVDRPSTSDQPRESIEDTIIKFLKAKGLGLENGHLFSLLPMKEKEVSGECVYIQQLKDLDSSIAKKANSKNITPFVKYS